MNNAPLNDEKNILDAMTAHGYGPRMDMLATMGLRIVEDRRAGARIVDINGKSYIDCFCADGQFVLGHKRPDLTAKFREALKHLDLGNFVLLSAQKAELAKRLAEITPGDLKCTVYGVGRGESIDFALKLVRGYSGRKEIVAFDGAFHGHTGFALSVSDEKVRPDFFGPLIPGVKRVPLDSAALRKAVSDKTAAVIVEPIQTEAGIVFPPDGFLAAARSICDRTGAALIFDEGQTALGRTGTLFACNSSKVVPDVITIANGLGGTMYPITAAVFTSRLNRFMLKHPLIHLSTFAGADLGCAVAIATIDIIMKNKLWENAARMGASLLTGLNDVTSGKSTRFKGARGMGLLIGLEAANADVARTFVKNLAHNGVITMPALGNPAVVKFTPPIDITENEVESILGAVADAASF